MPTTPRLRRLLPFKQRTKCVWGGGEGAGRTGLYPWVWSSSHANLEAGGSPLKRIYSLWVRWMLLNLPLLFREWWERGWIRVPGLCNKVPLTSGLKQHSLTVLEAGDSKSRCQQGHLPSEGSGRESILASSALVGAGNCRHCLDCSCITPISASIVIWPSGPCLCVAPPLLTRTPITKLRTYFTLAWPHLNQLHLQRHFLDQEEHLDFSTEQAIPANHSAEPWERTHEKETQGWESGSVIGLRSTSYLIWGER